MSFFQDARNTSFKNSILRDPFTYRHSVGIEADLKTALHPVDNVAYNCSDLIGPVPKCYPGTRKDVIAEIVRWAKHDDSQVCWLSGPAGSGKSAILQTVAELYASEGSLISSFFWQRRGRLGKSEIASFIPTLAYQLSEAITSTRPFISRALQKNPSILTERRLRDQFNKLIIEPLLAVTDPISRFVTWTNKMVIIVDAVEQCSDTELIVEFIGILIEALRENHQLPLRVIVSSRVEKHISKKFEIDAARPVTHNLALDEFDARLDIHTYLQSCFSIIYDREPWLMGNILLPWPSLSDLDSLVEKCNGSFLSAVLLVNYIDSMDGLANDRLQAVLTAKGSFDTLIIPHTSRGDSVKMVEAILYAKPEDKGEEIHDGKERDDAKNEEDAENQEIVPWDFDANSKEGNTESDEAKLEGQHHTQFSTDSNTYSSIPKVPPEPLSYFINLTPLEELQHPIPGHNPNPPSVFLDLE